MTTGHNYLRRAQLLSALICIVTIFSAVAEEPIPGGGDAALRAAATRWADSVYSTLTVRQRFAQLMMPKLSPTGGTTSKSAVRRLSQSGVGGFIFSEGTLAQYAELNNYAQAQADIPLMMAFDGEWGLNMRIKTCPRFPSNMALGAVQSPRLLYDYGTEMARQCRLLGIQCNFAPDADVNSNPSNPVIGYRAFGEDPKRVATATVAYNLGLEDHGVQGTPKHFPGHGDTFSDSHKTVTTVNHDRAKLDSTDLVPFRRSIEAGASAIMMGHLVVPALDNSRTPASLSHTITTDILRKELGFEGLIYTDALGMKGAVDPAGRNVAVAAFCAGADVLLSPPAGSLDALVNAYNSGNITEEMTADRCKRVLRYKYYLGLSTKPTVNSNIAALADSIDTPRCRALIQSLSDACITVIRNDGSVLPVRDLAKTDIAVVTIGASDNADIFKRTCEFYAGVKSYHSNGGRFSTAAISHMRDADITIVAVFDDKAATRDVFAQVAGAGCNKLVAAFMVNPYKVKKFATSIGNAKAIVIGYDDIAEISRAAAEAVFGGIDVSGRLPVEIRGVADTGAGYDIAKSRLGFTTPVQDGLQPWLTDSIDAFAKQCLRAGAIPGCQILVARHGNIVYDNCFGHIGDSNSAAVTAGTVYDLASVSKATGTLSGIMKAYDSGLLSLDATLGDLIPEITDTAKQSISVRSLLYHETGMPASLNMYDVMFDSTSYSGKLIRSRRDATHTIRIGRNAYGHKDARLRTDIVKRTSSPDFNIEGARGLFLGQASYDTIMQRIYNIPLRANRKYNYSCLNFCLLMDIEQRLTGRRHDEYVHDEIFGPLGAYNTCYRPLTHLSAEQIAYTEKDTYMRRQLIHGYVHDELANFSGGVQGNAGLFANAHDIAKYCQMLLNKGCYGDARLLSEQTVALFMTSKSPTCRRGLGFDKPDVDNPDNSPTCEEAGAAVVGHLGFTGTCFWIDPEEDLFFVFLTNRVYPTRETPIFNRMDIRPHLFSLVYQSIAKR